MASGGSGEWPRIRDEVDWYEEDDATRNLGVRFRLRPMPRWSDHWVAPLGYLQASLGHRDLIPELLKLPAEPAVAQRFCG